MKTQLLCTFTKRNKFYETIDIIITCNDILFDKIYVFQNENDHHQLICTYNVEYDEDFMQGIPDTISLHRKKHTNTLYTINALNDLLLIDINISPELASEDLRIVAKEIGNITNVIDVEDILDDIFNRFCIGK